MGQRAHRSPPPTGGGLHAVPGVVTRSGATGAAEVASQLVHLAAKARLGAVWGVRDGGVPTGGLSRIVAAKSRQLPQHPRPPCLLPFAHSGGVVFRHLFGICGG